MQTNNLAAAEGDASYRGKKSRGQKRQGGGEKKGKWGRPGLVEPQPNRRRTLTDFWHQENEEMKGEHEEETKQVQSSEIK